MPKITKRVVDRLEPDPTGKDVFLWDSGDGALKGFGIRMKPSGAASYFVQYRNKEGRTRRLVLGQVGVHTPDEARDLAGDKLKEADKGGDPSADRHAIRKSITVSELCDLYVKDAVHHIKPSTLAMDKSRIKCHVEPLLGHLSVRSLTVADLEKFQIDIAAGKTAKSRKTKGRSGLQTGGRGVAARTVGMLGTILEFARRYKIITENPARDVKKFEDNKSKRFLSYEEIIALGKAMREAEGENKTGIAAIKTLLLTGYRKNEVLALPWAWVDTQAQTVRFGDTKTGAQIRPIGKAVSKIIDDRRPKEDGQKEWVFPADRGDGHFVGLPRVFARLCEKAKIQDASLHDLRHTFGSMATELGFSLLTIAGIVGHTVPGITARYAHIADSALILAADRVSDYIAGALEGKKKGEVIQLEDKKIKAA